MKFVHYEELDTDYGPEFESNLNAVITLVENSVRSSVTREDGRAVRFAHAKAYGLLKGEVEILSVDDPHYAQGVFATQGRHDALIRFSNGLGHLGADARLGSGCGMAIKIFDIPGPSMSDEASAGTMDYNLINHPVFFANTARDYITLARLFNELPDGLREPSRRANWLHAFVTRNGELPPEEWLWDELFALLGNTSKPLPNLLYSTFWSMGALRHGDYVAKVRVTPTTPRPDSGIEAVDPKASTHPVREVLVRESIARDHTFDLQVQLCADLRTMPVENTSIDWLEQLSPFVTVARITVPAQDVSSPENVLRADAMSFTPWRTPAKHQPVGQIQTVRRLVYERSSIIRHQLNSQPRHEPSSPDEIMR